MKILITGGSDGIGLEIAKKFAKEHYKVTLVARHKEKLEAARNLLEGKHHQLIAADLTREEDVRKLSELIKEEKYNIFINNAGAGMSGRFSEMSLRDQLEITKLNITAVVTLSHSYLGQACSGNALVNIASTLGLSSYPGGAVYAATKSFIVNFSESLWWEYKKKDVYVLGFCPGATDTNFHQTSGADKGSIPRALLQTPEQVARELINALELRQKPRVISGSMNRFIIALQKLMSRKRVVNMMGGSGPLKAEA